jgi:small-conductance mechanosensitive channel
MNKGDSFNFSPAKVYDLLKGKLDQWLTDAVSMLPNFVVAVLVLLLFVFLAKVARNIFSRLANRVSDNISLTNLMSSVLHMAIISLGTFISLSILKLDGAVTSLLAGAGVIGLALGFAFQDIAANFIAGTMMSLRKPFREGDLIETNDFFGKVIKIHLRTTDIETLQGQHIMIPNAEVFKKPLTNYSRKQRRRIDIEVGVHYNSNLPNAKKIALEAVQNIEGVNPDDVKAFYHSFGGSSINFTLQVWQNFTNQQATFLKLQDEAILAIKAGFDREGITIPFPMRTLDLGDVDFKGIFDTYNTSKNLKP